MKHTTAGRRTPFYAILQKKTSLKNLNWKNVLKQKCLCLDENDPKVSTIAFPQHTNWEERTDLMYDPALRKAPLILDSDQQMETRQGEELGVSLQSKGVEMQAISISVLPAEH